MAGRGRRQPRGVRGNDKLPQLLSPPDPVGIVRTDLRSLDHRVGDGEHEVLRAEVPNLVPEGHELGLARVQSLGHPLQTERLHHVEDGRKGEPLGTRWRALRTLEELREHVPDVDGGKRVAPEDDPALQPLPHRLCVLVLDGRQACGVRLAGWRQPREGLKRRGLDADVDADRLDVAILCHDFRNCLGGFVQGSLVLRQKGRPRRHGQVPVEEELGIRHGDLHEPVQIRGLLHLPPLEELCEALGHGLQRRIRLSVDGPGTAGRRRRRAVRGRRQGEVPAEEQIHVPEGARRRLRLGCAASLRARRLRWHDGGVRVAQEGLPRLGAADEDAQGIQGDRRSTIAQAADQRLVKLLLLRVEGLLRLGAGGDEPHGASPHRRVDQHLQEPQVVRTLQRVFHAKALAVPVRLELFLRQILLGQLAGIEHAGRAKVHASLHHLALAHLDPQHPRGPQPGHDRLGDQLASQPLAALQHRAMAGRDTSGRPGLHARLALVIAHGGQDEHQPGRPHAGQQHDAVQQPLRDVVVSAPTEDLADAAWAHASQVHQPAQHEIGQAGARGAVDLLRLQGVVDQGLEVAAQALVAHTPLAQDHVKDVVVLVGQSAFGVDMRIAKIERHSQRFATVFTVLLEQRGNLVDQQPQEVQRLRLLAKHRIVQVHSGLAHGAQQPVGGHAALAAQ
eukprot:scaffold3747_cov240-Pinguiococcus_pyrenoidosus.AAC.10